jgi:hypothetical protein
MRATEARARAGAAPPAPGGAGRGAQQEAEAPNAQDCAQIAFAAGALALPSPWGDPPPVSAAAADAALAALERRALRGIGPGTPPRAGAGSEAGEAGEGWSLETLGALALGRVTAVSLGPGPRSPRAIPRKGAGLGDRGRVPPLEPSFHPWNH